MTPEQRTNLIAACELGDEVKIITLALQIAAKSARDGKVKEAVAIRHLIDAHQGREQAEKEYKRQRQEIATQVLAGLVANPGGPYQSSPRCGWGLVNCTREDIAYEAVRIADSLIDANQGVPIPNRTSDNGPNVPPDSPSINDLH